MSDLRVYNASELGADGYPLAWHATIKHDVRAAANHRCVRCGHPYKNGEHGSGEWSPCDGLCEHGDPSRDASHPYSSLGQNTTTGGLIREAAASGGARYIEAQWRILTVHHLDGDKSNCRWWNLAALCQRCHLTIQGRVVMERAFIFEHSEWFKSYAAGWYAWKYLGEELTRDEALARSDELLGLERLA